MENNRDFIGKIKELKKIEPHLEWKTLNRDFLLRQIKQDIPQKKVSIGILGYGQFIGQAILRPVFQPAVIMMLMLVAFLGSGLLANAAFYSLPGEPLYRVKIALEKTQLAVTSNQDKQIELKIEFARNRVNELDKIVQQSNVNAEVKKEQINMVAQEFKKNVVAVREHMEKINNDKPNENILSEDAKQTLQIAMTISSKVDELAKDLGEKTDKLPEQEKEIMAEAVNSAQEASLSVQELIKGSVKGESVEETGQDIIDINQPTPNTTASGSPEINKGVAE
jgi:hypothetical protein